MIMIAVVIRGSWKIQCQAEWPPSEIPRTIWVERVRSEWGNIYESRYVINWDVSKEVPSKTVSGEKDY